MTTTCTAHIRSRTGHPVQRLVLEMPSGFRFVPGQYLEVLHPEGAIPLSIASAPWRLPQLHLHYRSSPGVAEAARMDALLQSVASLDIGGPAGDVTLPSPLPAPALIVAGGTGIAQAMSFIDAFVADDPGGAVTLLWCVDRDHDFYLRRELEALAAPWLKRVLIADPERSRRNRGLEWLRERAGAFAQAPGDGDRGRRGPAGAMSPVILAGGPAFVYAAYDALMDAGLSPRQIRSDVFGYAPRPP